MSTHPLVPDPYDDLDEMDDDGPILVVGAPTVAEYDVVAFDVIERRIALYVSDVVLTSAMRGNRARLIETAERGVEVVGLFELLGFADEFRALARHAHVDNCPDARAQLVEMWPDRARSRLARKLAQSPAWDTGRPARKGTR